MLDQERKRILEGLISSMSYMDQHSQLEKLHRRTNGNKSESAVLHKTDQLFEIIR